MSKFGILLAISSLPSNHGIGDFGIYARKFVDFLKKNDQSYWQILPLNPIGPGNSPYMSTCSFAIDPIYISLDDLKEEGYISELEDFRKDEVKVDYDKVRKYKICILNKAFESFISNPDADIELNKFLTKNKWAFNYAIYECLKLKNKNKYWNKWPKKDIEYSLSYGMPSEHLKEGKFIIWSQMIAYNQWNKLKKYANDNGIKIIADLPFFVGLDSVDCWANRSEFLFDDKYNLISVSGVTPDGFSKEGQVWGTPIYDFNKMKLNDYSFLIERISYVASLSDVLRLDHFRAFDTYCMIPGSDENGLRGVWAKGPSYEFFDMLYKKYPTIDIIAEDLGDLFESVHELRDHYNLPGMYVGEFYLTDLFNHSNENQIVYPGTHDNMTLKSWLKTLDSDEINLLKLRLNTKQLSNIEVLNYIKNMSSKITIISMQDYLGLDDKTRLNTPGTMGSPNWEWKLKSLD